MANSKQNQGRIVLIDPNEVNDSPTGLVTPEDLMVYVDLEVDRKPRTIIAIDSNINTPAVYETSGNKIKFISGSKEPGRDDEVLTTNYTRLTTVLTNKEGQPNSESFGIRNISIDFDTAYTPMIKIDFIDIHGSSLFELGNQSKYNVFFNLPYPIFKLTVKGFYGPSVTYCLHLLKFNSRFNSETGNFEITANFIGYTFAFLSDMLIGYLRAAVETPRGKELFEEEKAKNPQLLTINELMIQLSQAQQEIKKMAATNNEVKALESSKNVKEIYGEYRSRVDAFINGIGSNILINSTKKDVDGREIISHLYIIDGYSTETDVNKLTKGYYDDLDDYAKINNQKIADPALQLPKNSKSLIKIIYPFNSDKYANNGVPVLDASQEIRYLGDETNKNISTLLSGSTNYVMADFLMMYDELDAKKSQIEAIVDNTTKAVANVVDNNLFKILGFKSSIYNFINIFTTHVEVFIKLIELTSIDAMNSANRKSELSRLVQSSLNVKPSDYNNKNFYPWPEYNEETEDGVIEKWIGTNIAPIPETILVEEMLIGFLKSGIADNAAANLNAEFNSYYPTNIFDIKNISKVLGPYDELLLDNEYKHNIEKLLLGTGIRLFNFSHCNLNQTNNRPFYKNIFAVIGKFEAQQVFDALSRIDYDKNTINALINFEGGDIRKQVQKVKDIFLNGHINIATPLGVVPFMVEYDETYEYIYIRSNDKQINETNITRGYLPNFNSFSKLNDFYDSNGKMLSHSELKDKFINSGYPQYIGFGTHLSIRSCFTGTCVDTQWESTFFNNTDDGSTYWVFYDDDEYALSLTFPTLDSLSSTPRLIPQTETTTININTVLLDVSESQENPVEYDGPVMLYSSLVSLAPNKLTYILTSPLKVNDLRYILFDKKVGPYLQGLSVSSAMFAYKDAIVNNFDYSYASVPTKYVESNVNTIGKKLEPSWFIDYDSQYFSPMCYTIYDVAANKPSLINNANVQSTPDFNQPTVNSPISDEVLDNITDESFQDDLSLESDATGTVTNINTTGIYFDENDVSYVDSGILTTTKGSINKWYNSSLRDFSLMKEKNNELWQQQYREAYGLRDDQGINIIDDINELMGANRLGVIPSMVNKSNTDEVNKTAITYPQLCTFGKNRTQLFGSEFYLYQQKNDDYQDAVRVRGYLFLNMLPLQGNFRNKEGEQLIDNAWSNILLQPGLQEIPYSYILLIGSRLWYKKSDTAKIYFETDTGEKLIPNLRTYPTKNTSLLADDGLVPLEGSNFTEDIAELHKLPISIQEYCINEFLDWSEIRDADRRFSWGWIRKRFELMDFDNITSFSTAYAQWTSYWTNFQYTMDYIYDGRYYCFDGLLPSDFATNSPYIVFQPHIENENDFKTIKINGGGNLSGIGYNLKNKYRYDYYCFTNHKSGKFNDTIWGFLGQRKTLAKYVGGGLMNYTNNGSKVAQNESFYFNPTVNIKDLELFYAGFFSELNELLKDPVIVQSNKDELKKQVFGVIDNDLIRLNIYRQLSAIYTKWIGGSQNNLNIPCISDKDKNNKTVKLIDRFKFIDRAYNDISQKLIINPYQIYQYIWGNFNQSFYDLVGSKILANNNIDFIPLPTFINFRDPKEVEQMFQTYNVNIPGNFSSIGPAFVCVYVGQTSQFLDLGGRSDYINDGIDFIEGQLTGAKDFDSDGTLVPVVVVNYSDPKQSIFKDIKLDQAEFSETDESLQLIDNLTNSKQTFVGQNLYNIYSVRSYSSEITMMGNLTMQPYMYFQLNNIPMFHGGYMITKVSHQIEPHYVSTTFKGVRVKRVRTPLVDEELIYTSIINEFTSGNTENVSIIEGQYPIHDDTVITDSGQAAANRGDNLWRKDGRLSTPEILTFESPTQGKYRISSPIGARGSVAHLGTDVACPSGEPIKSVASGKIREIGINTRYKKNVIIGGYGLFVIVEHTILGRTFVSLYGHLSDLSDDIKRTYNIDINNPNDIARLRTRIFPGLYDTQELSVSKGGSIGKSGGNPAIGNPEFAGNSPAAHLHFELKKFPEGYDTSNPNFFGDYFNLYSPCVSNGYPIDGARQLDQSKVIVCNPIKIKNFGIASGWIGQLPY